MDSRFLLDSNIHDKLIGEPDLLPVLARHVAEGRMELLSTHVQADEIAETPDPRRASALMEVPVKQVETSGIVFGVSRFGQARFAESEPLEKLRRGNLAHTKDALIANTARLEGATLVTEDRTLASRAREQGIPAIGWEEFRALVVSD